MDASVNVRWTILENSQAVAHEACDRILQAAKLAIKERGKFHIVLAGGSTPERTYALLAETDSDWECWHLWFGDERCLPVDHADRNSLMIERRLLSKVAIAAEQVHVIPAELGAKQAAKQYARLLDGYQFDSNQLFDLVLLGMGEDGHTASLFPGHSHSKGDSVLPVYEAPKFPAERVSLSAESLSRARSVIFIISGKRKSRAISRWRQGEELPVSKIRGTERTEALIDKDAWPEN